MSKKIVHIFISGKVQGVSYRSWFKNEGEKRSLKGWVRNRTNRVEAEVNGDKRNIDEMVQKCKSGPLLAKVDEVIVNPINKVTNVVQDIKGIKILETI